MSIHDTAQAILDREIMKRISQMERLRYEAKSLVRSMDVLNPHWLDEAGHDWVRDAVQMPIKDLGFKKDFQAEFNQ